jgi:hypothetical protein
MQIELVEIEVQTGTCSGITQPFTGTCSGITQPFTGTCSGITQPENDVYNISIKAPLVGF